jgi:hypothetical protein
MGSYHLPHKGEEQNEQYARIKVGDCSSKP